MPPYISAEDASSAAIHQRYWTLVPAAIVVAALYFGRPILLPLAVAVLLAFALAPFVARLRRMGAGRVLSVLVAATLSIVAMIGIGFFVATKTVELAGELPMYQSNLVAKIQSIRGTTLETGAAERLFALVKNLRAQVGGIATPAQPAPQKDAQPVPVEIAPHEPAPLDLAVSALEPLLVFLAGTGIAFIFMVFILLHKDNIRDRFIGLAGVADIQKTTLLLDDGADRLGDYLLSQTAINAVFGAVAGIGLYFIGIPSAALWGLAVAVFRFVPYIGVPLAAIFPVLLALSVDPGWSMAMMTAGLFVIAELLVGQAVEPWWFGRQMGLSSLAVVVAAAFWSLLWGPVGLLLSTPLTVCLVVLGRHVEHLRFLDVLLGDKPPLAVEEALYTRMLGDDADEAAAEAEHFLKTNSLCKYFDGVVLKALAIGQLDVRRGALDSERAQKIRNTTEALLENLIIETPAAKKAQSDAEGEDSAKIALCIGGRGPLDEAAALLLVHLLSEAGIAARLATEREAAAAVIDDRDGASPNAVCVCYLDAGNFTRARYVLRRLKRRFPEAATFAAFWGYDSDLANASQTSGYEIVTSLEQAVHAIAAAVNPPAAALAEDAAE